MKRTVIDCAQRSAEWYAARLGIPTASGMSALVTPLGVPTKGAKRVEYRNRLLAERLTGSAGAHYVSPAMERGIELEPSALAWYELSRGVELAHAGFIRADGDGWACGCSPDGLVGSEGGVEVKCPLGHNMIDALLCDTPPDEYLPQVQASLWVTGRQWWDLCLYSGTAGIPHRVWRIDPAPAFHDALSKIVPAFCAELAECEQRLTALGGGMANCMAGAAEALERGLG